MNAAADVRRLYKSRTDKMIDGVCGGIAEYLAIDATFVRLAFVFLIFMGGIGLLLYFICMMILPSPPVDTTAVAAAPRENHGKRNTTFWAVLLIALGVFWFFSNIGLGCFFHWWALPWHVLIPLLLIGAGVAFLMQSKDGTQTVQPGAPTRVGSQRLYRSRTEYKILGVCGGIGTYVNADPTIIRVLFIAAGLASAGFVILLYVIMGIVVPKEPAVAQPA